jgi:hypothetical protein
VLGFRLGEGVEAMFVFSPPVFKLSSMLVPGFQAVM